MMILSRWKPDAAGGRWEENIYKKQSKIIQEK